MSVTKDEWWSLIEVRMAERLASGDPAAFVGCLIDIIDSDVVGKLRLALEDRGIGLEKLMDMRSEVAAAEHDNADAEYRNAGNRDSHLLTDEARKAVRRLFYAHFDENQVADLLELEAARVGEYLSKVDPDSRKIFDLHVKGKTIAQIVEATGSYRSHVQDVIESVGEEPHRDKNRITAEQRAHVLHLRSAAGGTLGYTKIAELVGIDYYAVRNVCRTAAVLTAGTNRADL